MIRTGFSFKVAAGHTEDVLSRIQEIGWKVAPICDRASEFGFVKYTKAAKKLGLRPLYGVELAVTNNSGDDKPTTDHWRFMAKTGLRDINELVWAATNIKGREPMLSYQEAMQTTGVIRITGERARFDHFVPDADTYVGLSPSVSRGYYRLAKSHGHKFVAVSDNYYPRATDKEFYRVMLGRFSGTQIWPMHILSDEEWTKWMQDTGIDNHDIGAALANRDNIFDQCQAVLGKADILVTDKPQTLMEMCRDGAVKLGIDLSDPRYGPRLEHEVKMIYEKKFEDYFYILSDMVNWARDKMIVGPARGSSCGSLACYLLGITTVDPIPFDLLFERFIDITRADLPDIDIDFSDLRRHLVFEYAEQKYGKDRVARLGSVGTFQAKSALNQAGISLRIAQWKIDKLSESIIQRKYGDSRASQTIEDTLNTTEPGRALMEEHPEVVIAARMEDHPQAAGQHAAGVVITERSIKDYIAIDRTTGATMCDKYDAEDLNLLKIDALGLTQLGIFERVLDLIGVPSVSGWMEKHIQLDDPKAYEVLNKKHFAGIFQFDGAAVKSLCKAIVVDKFDDMVALTALARPGPLSSGGAEMWTKRRNGKEIVEAVHPLVEPYTQETLGCIIYQEQVMKIGREVGDLTWAEVTELRKAMSKSLGVEYFNKFGDKWKAGAMKRGMPKEIADSFWDDLCEFGSWGFNKSHSVAYGFLSYWCCWFKAHHPLEFAAATLDALTTPDKQIRLLRELREEGVAYIPVDADASGALWEIAEKADGKRYLVGPLSQVKGVGPKTVDEILTARKRGEPIRSTVAKKFEKPKTPIDTLFPVKTAVEHIVGGDLANVKITSTPKDMIECQPGTPGEVVVIAIVDRIMPSDMNALQKIAQRNGRKFTGPTMALNMYAHDDTDEMLVRIERFDYERMAKPIVERGRAGKAIYAFKGRVPDDFRMLRVTQVKYLGELQ